MQIISSSSGNVFFLFTLESTYEILLVCYDIDVSRINIKQMMEFCFSSFVAT